MLRQRHVSDTPLRPQTPNSKTRSNHISVNLNPNYEWEQNSGEDKCPGAGGKCPVPLLARGRSCDRVNPTRPDVAAISTSVVRRAVIG